MGGILNGMSLVKVRPFGSGFFIFVDYMRDSLRLSALMELLVIYVLPHDSAGVVWGGDPIPVSAKVGSPEDKIEQRKTNSTHTFVVRGTLCEYESVCAVGDLRKFRRAPRRRALRWLAG
jgi:hypothetical protein